MNPCEEMRQLFLKMFNERGEQALSFLCTASLPSQLFMSKYKDFAPIETLLPEEKKKMKLYVHELFPGKTVEFKLQAAKIIYTIGTML